MSIVGLLQAFDDSNDGQILARVLQPSEGSNKRAIQTDIKLI